MAFGTETCSNLKWKESQLPFKRLSPQTQFPSLPQYTHLYTWQPSIHWKSLCENTSSTASAVLRFTYRTHCVRLDTSTQAPL